MEAVDKIISFAEMVAKEDKAMIAKYDAWIAFITPKFKEAFNLKYEHCLRSLYPPDKDIWLTHKRQEFEKQYKPQN